MDNNFLYQHLSEPDESDFYLPDYDNQEEDDSNFINTILSGTARLNVLLPTATILAFTIFAPIQSNATSLRQWMTGIFMILSAASCVLHYGVATFSGIWTFNGRRIKPCVPRDYRLRWSDIFFHASLSLIALLTFAASHTDVLQCKNDLFNSYHHQYYY
ncbi:hypothetical protein R3W88_008762 [Solanum pinnatisectum]|uniref:Uncharacterized protein n=1 Tax=Solanum pinnatisectum TaxID=50273 RepID=A0AAV9M903_9SOLN|nr:hypothetical protein R3W88_008762 [Solanum pinnatisectum]